ncbi:MULTISPECIES: asparagine synthase [unclassified Amycolatopsis]|uniref:asparagine synthase n=1 Tax=unclassified Amycolatopsis TaxID=2618356 RepID=UPI001431E01F|nr:MULTISPECIES: asparagine synthase [unclassified Amycolatopsis]
MQGFGVPFFVVLPDNTFTDAVALHPRLSGAGVDTSPHPSGRPWLVGRWDERELLTVTVGTTRVALIGCFAAKADELRGDVGRIRQLSDTELITRKYPGSYHVAIAIGDRMRIQGTASGLRRVYHAEFDGIPVVADQADVLADLTRAELRVPTLAVRLLQPSFPLSERPLWSGVTPVEPGDCVEVAGNGRTVRVRRWWTPPPASRGMAESAAAVRAALASAVSVRTKLNGHVSTELSGGFDSTSVTFLAARNDVPLTACTALVSDSTVDDNVWASRAVAHLPCVRHEVIPANEIPLCYAGMNAAGDLLDEPSAMVVFRERALGIVARMAERGARHHLTGHGGDHLFTGSPAHWHTLARTKPLRAFRELRAFRISRSWPLSRTVRAVLRNQTFPEAFAAVDLTRGRPLDMFEPRLGWNTDLHLPGWLTADAEEMIAGEIGELAARVAPLASSRGTHAELSAIRSGTRDIRALARMSRGLGVETHAPFFDDQVIDAALGAAPEHRATAWRYKPLLAVAMRDIVPGPILDRTTKADGTVDAVRGLRHHQAELAEMWEDSQLGRLGLVDPGRLRSVCARIDPLASSDLGLSGALACETWLRARRHEMARPRSER